jgi:hypothetical protein
MASQAISLQPEGELQLSKVASFHGLRALAWHENLLYASRGYELLCAHIRPDAREIRWQHVARYDAAPPRQVSSRSRLGSRLFRDGFHALTVLPSGYLVAAVPRAIVTLAPGEKRFRVSHQVLRGTRPLHIAPTPEGHVFWGEYFDNPGRDEVHIYGSTDRGLTWNVAHTFPKAAIRHVHNAVYDRWGKCFWVLTGDDGRECQILRASCDFKTVDVILCGSQQTRSAAIVPTADGLYFSSDTPSESNHVYRIDRRGNLATVADLPGSSIYGCRVGDAVFFSTMAEPSETNAEESVGLYGSSDGLRWQRLLLWKKDSWPMRLFQYGNAFLPDGHNATHLLAVSTVAVENDDCKLNLFAV